MVIAAVVVVSLAAVGCGVGADRGLLVQIEPADSATVPAEATVAARERTVATTSTTSARRRSTTPATMPANRPGVGTTLPAGNEATAGGPGGGSTTSATTPGPGASSTTVTGVPTTGTPTTAGPNGSTSTSAPGTTTTAAPPIVLRRWVRGADEVLTDGDGHALYVSLADSGTTPSCLDACATVWSPLPGTVPDLGPGIDGALVGVVQRADGSRQLAYSGRPLYRLIGDGPLQATGQGRESNWYLVDVTGLPVMV